VDVERRHQHFVCFRVNFVWDAAGCSRFSTRCHVADACGLFV
jgi:hypothetical protein